MTARIAEVAFNLPLDRTFHYLVPPELHDAAQPGVRVRAPFGRNELTGFIVSRPSESPRADLKPLRRALDAAPVISGERWALAGWMAGYYACSLGEALAAMVPTDLAERKRPAKAGNAHDRAGGPAVRGGEEMPHDANRAAGGPAAGAAQRESTRPAHVLTSAQRQGFDVIRGALDARGGTILLHGITGSGKTELYLQAIAHVLQRGGSAVCLIPEISLTPQAIERFQERFGAEVAVWHSRLTPRQRADEWRRIADGRRRVIVGARSAVFAPAPSLQLIVIDEEHEASYKQEATPRYHAREVAQERMRETGGTLILGSATPSIESFYAAASGPYRLVPLPERVEGRALPRVDIIDMRQQFSRRRAGPLSDPLHRALERTIERGEQAILLLNRRGFARVAQCQTCGTVSRCGTCSVPMIYHASLKALICHYCNARLEPPDLCAVCKKGYVKFRGAGTERVESELNRVFPAAKVARMDRDTTKKRQSYQELYEALKSRQIGVLVGTQMVAKGHDFPQVTLVGVVSADTALNLPDFRAGERTFDLLVQVAGRAGRGDQPGSVLVQTYCPTHYAIQAASTHDYRKFYDDEIEMRRRVKLPPFMHLVELTLHGSARQNVIDAAVQLANALRPTLRAQHGALLGPAPHRIPRLRREYRMCVLMKGARVEPMVALLRETLGPGRRYAGVPVTVDVDPV